MVGGGETIAIKETRVVFNAQYFLPNALDKVSGQTAHTSSERYLTCFMRMQKKIAIF